MKRTINDLIFRTKKAIRCFKKESAYKLIASREGLFTLSIAELEDTLERLEHRVPRDEGYILEVRTRIDKAISSQSHL